MWTEGDMDFGFWGEEPDIEADVDDIASAYSGGDDNLEESEEKSTREK